MSRRRVWTERTCVGCGAVYEFDTFGVGQRAVPVLSWFSTAGEPACPECGCVPPAGTASRKRVFHIPPTLLFAIFGVSFGGIALINTPGYSYSAACLALGVIAAVFWLTHAAIAFADPNRRRDRNARRSRRLEQIGLVELVNDPDPDLAEPVPGAVSSWSYPLLLVGLVGVLLVFGPFVLKAVSGWPVNPHTSPELVGPGDTLRVWFPDHVQAVNGKWSGTSQAELLVEGQPQSVLVPATASQQIWGNSISGKTVSNSRTQLWTDVKLPDDPALVGKRVEVRVDVTYRYPHDVGGWFEEMDGEASTSQTYTLADRGASGTYRASFYLAGVGGALLTLCGVGLIVVAHRQVVAARRR